MTLTKRGADALATLIAELRDDWDRTGIITALRTAHTNRTSDPWRITLAAIHAAADPTNRSPGVIALKGKHWTGTDLNSKRAADKTCPKCGQWPESHHDGECPKSRNDRRHEWAAMARRVVAEARQHEEADA